MFDRVCEIELDPWTEVIGTLKEMVRELIGDGEGKPINRLK